MYQKLKPELPLVQGEIIDDCPLLFWHRAQEDSDWEVNRSFSRVLLLSQACDLNSPKLTRAQVAVVHGASELVEAGILKANMIRDQLTRHRVFGWYFLPAMGDFPESVVDLRDIHTVERALLEELAFEGKRVITLKTPFREHLSQHFAVTFSRIGLPEPYQTEP